MSNTIKIKNSGTASNVPSTLEFGELAINYADGKLYYKNSSNSIVQFEGQLAASALQNVVEDITPQLGGALDVNGKEITGAIDLHSTGDIVAELGDDAGTNKLSIRDSSGAEVSSIDSNGSFSAATKSFDIKHPTKDNMRLRYGSVEAPEHSVQVRGRCSSGVIILPDYWEGLIDDSTITVQLTAMGRWQRLFVKSFSSRKVVVGGFRGKDFFYTVSAERKDVPKLVVEYGD